MEKKSDCSKHKRAEAKQWDIKIESPAPLMINTVFARQRTAKVSLNVALA